MDKFTKTVVTAALIPSAARIFVAIAFGIIGVFVALILVGGVLIRLGGF